MKEILCFGDSNTFGFIPGSGQRYNKTERWSGILSGLLSENYRIIEAGCNNRTAFSPNPEGDLFTGTKSYSSIFGQPQKYGFNNTCSGCK